MQTNAKNHAPAIVYPFKNGLYINLTNRCPNACQFCLKNKFNMNFEGFNLNLNGAEPSAQEVLAAVEDLLPQHAAREAVFCGYGEPTMQLEVLLQAASAIKAKHPSLKIRLNTVGLGNLVHGRDITGQLAQVLDEVNVSLNSPDEAEWQKIVRPQPQYSARGYAAVLDFIKNMAQKLPGGVVVSIVDKQGVNAARVKQLAQSLGAQIRVRTFI